MRQDFKVIWFVIQNLDDWILVFYHLSFKQFVLDMSEGSVSSMYTFILFTHFI